MKNTFLVLVASLILLIGCADEQFAGGTDGPGPKGEPVRASIEFGEDSYYLGETVVYENVAVVPLISKDFDPQKEADYITLAEATKNDWIEIIEKPGEETVEELTVRYNGPKPLLLLAGELLLGGKQDRVVAHDTAIDPMSEATVAVYCVEPGRWSGSSLFGYSGTQVPSSVKEQALLGAQGDVWAETSTFNDLARASNSGRSTVDMGLKSEDVTKFTDDGKKALLKVIENDDAIVGVLFVINGEVHSLELFSAPRLLESAYGSILGGILAEASVQQGVKYELPRSEDYRTFLSNISQSGSEALAQGGAVNGNIEVKHGSIAGMIYDGSSEDKRITHGTFYNKKD